LRDRSGINRLARAIDSRLTQRLQSPDSLELAVIQSDMSLKIDRFPIPIPPEDYLVTRTVAYDLEPGDRVLVAWVNNHKDPVVIDVVMANA